VPDKKDDSRLIVSAVESGVHPYLLRVKAGAKPLGEISGTLVAAKWQTTFFKWTASIDPSKESRSLPEIGRRPHGGLGHD